MKAVSFSCAAILTLVVVGCAGKASHDEAGDEEDIKAARPSVDLASTEDGSSVQAKLFQLFRTFQADPGLGITGPTDSNLLVLEAVEPQALVRSIGCHETARTDPTALAPIFSHECTLTGFDAVKNGASLPPTSVTGGPNPVLANKLFSLLSKGEQKGGLGVKRGGINAGCCDQQSTTSFTISDAHSSLSCTSTSGGFISITSVSCLLLRQDAIPPEVVKGSLVRTVGVGGENTGFSASIDGKTVELVLEAADASNFVTGRIARITGMPTTLSGVETQGRQAIDVSNFLVCPAPKTPLSLKSPVSDDTKWLAANCPNLGPSTH